MGLHGGRVAEGRNVFGYRVAGATIAAASVLACGLALDLGAGTALAQYEPVGKPLQLVPQIYSGKPAAAPRNRVAAKKAARSESRAEIRSEARSASQSEAAAEPRTQQRVSLRRKHRPPTEMAEQKRPQRAAAAASPETTAPTAVAAAPQRARAAPPPSAPAATTTATPLPQATPPAAPAATTAAALPPQAAPPAAAKAGELMVNGQAVQVRSPDEANELDLAANEPGTTASAPASEPALSPGNTPLYNLAATSPPAEADAAPAVNAAPPVGVTPAAGMEPAHADAAQPKSPIGSAFWIMQIMAALGGAAAAGSAAWFLIGSASPRIKVSGWQEADGE
jgi:hypothetical protein